MKTRTTISHRLTLFFVFVCLSLRANAEPFQLVSVLNSALNAPAGGSGDSLDPVISPDGRYVLFASAANNLVLNSSTNPITPILPLKMNVFLRDRTNGTTILISVNFAGTGGGNGDSLPVDISTNGQYVLFESSATNLVAGDTNGVTDVFVRDLVHNTTALVSVSTNGGFGNGVSRSSVMTPGGRYVAFVSAASNLVPGDNNGIADIFVRDLQDGTTTLASVGASGAGNSSELPDITPDGHYVAFYSTATNLIPGVQATGEIYVRNLVSGITAQASAGAHAIALSVIGTTNTISYNHTISDDGQFVAYEASSSANPLTEGIILRYSMITGLTDIVNTNATGLPASGNELNHRCLDMTPNGRFIAFVANNGSAASDIYEWDAQSAITTLVSTTTNNALPSSGICDWPVMDPTGRYISFLSTSFGLVTNQLNSFYNLYLRDMQAGATTLIDVDTNRAGVLTIPTFPRMSTNGAIVAFESFDGSLVANDNNHAYDVFVSNLAGNAIELTSAHLPALPSLTPNGPSTLSTLSVSTNARYVAFYSEANNLVAGDSNGFRDVFVRDLLIGTNILVSVDTNGVFPGTGLSTDAAISADGRYVAFTSSASNLVASVADANNAQDVFVRDLQLATTKLVSVNTNGNGPGNAASYSPILSFDGRYVLFRSKASNLAPGPFTAGSFENLYWRDLQTGTTLVLTTNSSTVFAAVASMTADGHNVAFGGTGANLYIWNAQSNKFTYTNSAAIGSVSISPSGTRLAYSVGVQVHAVDLASNSNVTIASSPATITHAGSQFSGDNRYVAYVALDSSRINQIYLYDFQTQLNILVSKSFSTSVGGNSISDSPVISTDGHFIAYRSLASNIVPNDNNGVADVFLYDRTTGDTTLVSVSEYGNTSADARSLRPVLSADGQTLVFQSLAADLVPQDGNQGYDLFALSLYSSNSLSSFSVGILQPSAGQGPTLTWPVVTGVSYQVQFKNHLNDAFWQVLNGNVTLVGNQGYVTDLAPATGQRFYRILGTN